MAGMKFWQIEDDRNNADLRSSKKVSHITMPEKRQEKSIENPEKDTKKGIDPFILEKLFPNAHEVFSASSTPDPKNTCIVALDTNALLLPYSVGKDDLGALGTVYSQIAGEGRLFLPERVAREFIKNRDRKLAEMALAIDNMKSKLNIGEARISPLLEALTESANLNKANEKLLAAKKEYIAILDNLTSQIRSWRGNDPVTSLYASVFTQERLAAPADKDNDLRKEWAYRVENKVPPGYKDGGKEDLGIGDFAIWMSLLNLGATHKKDMIFVTGEEKADWFVRAGSTRVYPRPELVDEYRRASSGRTLRLSSLHDLLREMSAPEGLVNDVKAAESKANTALQMYYRSQNNIGMISDWASWNVTMHAFDYSTNDGKMRIESNGKLFDLAFSKASDTSIHLYRTGSTRRIARLRKADINLPLHLDHLETSSFHYTLNTGEYFFVENEVGDILAGKIISITDDLHGADHDKVIFEYAVSGPGARIFLP